MSHGDQVTAPPPGSAGHRPLAPTPSIVGFEDPGRGLYCIQFHPEVSHTVAGAAMLHNFLYRACHARGDWTMAGYLDEAVDRHSRPGRRQPGAVRHLGRRRLGGHRRAARTRHRRPARLGVRRHRAAAQGGAPPGRGEPDRGPRHSGHHRRRRRASSSPRSPASRTRRPSARRSAGSSSRPSSARREALEGVDFLAQGTLYPDVIESTSVRGPVGGDQVAPQRRRAAGAARLRAGRAAALAVQGRGAPARPRARPARGVHRPPPLPGPGARRAHPRRGHPGAGRPAPGGRRHLPRRAARQRLVRASARRPSRCCCRSSRSA